MCEDLVGHDDWRRPWRAGMLLGSNVQRPGMLLHDLQSTGHHPRQNITYCKCQECQGGEPVFLPAVIQDLRTFPQSHAAWFQWLQPLACCVRLSILGKNGSDEDFCLRVGGRTEKVIVGDFL